MVSPSPEQIRQALLNTVQQPRSDARLIYAALKKRAAIRDGREKVCPSCFVDRLKGKH